MRVLFPVALPLAATASTASTAPTAVADGGWSVVPSGGGRPSFSVRAEGLFGRRLLDRAPRTVPVELPPGRRVRLSEPWPDRPVLDVVDVRLTVTADGGAARDAGSAAVRFVPWAAVAGISGGATAAGASLVASLVTSLVAFLAIRRSGRRGAAARAEEPGPGRGEVELTGAVT